MKIFRLAPILVCFLFIAFITLPDSGAYSFSDPSTIVIEKLTGRSLSYHYVSKSTGKKCGVADDLEFMGASSYAFPTQWWNFSELRYQSYATPAEAKAAVEKLCPTGVK